MSKEDAKLAQVVIQSLGLTLETLETFEERFLHTLDENQVEALIILKEAAKENERGNC